MEEESKRRSARGVTPAVSGHRPCAAEWGLEWRYAQGLRAPLELTTSRHYCRSRMRRSIDARRRSGDGRKEHAGYSEGVYGCRDGCRNANRPTLDLLAATIAQVPMPSTASTKRRGSTFHTPIPPLARDQPRAARKTQKYNHSAAARLSTISVPEPMSATPATK